MMKGKQHRTTQLLPVPLYKKSLLLPLHWTSPCGALRETQGELPFEASFIVCLLCLLHVYYLNTLA